MIIEVSTSQGGYLACQAIAQVQIRNRSVGRSVLEGVVRELLELHLDRTVKALEGREVSSGIMNATPKIHAALGRDLERRGIPLTTLELRPVLVDPEPQAWRARPYLWVEFVSPEVATMDGFQVVVDTASQISAISETSPLDTLQANRATRGALEEAVLSSCQGMALEDLLLRRAQWTDQILEMAATVLDNAGMELRCLAITDVQVRARKEAFRPVSKRVLDPLLNFTFMPYGDVVKDPQKEDVDRP